MPLRFHNRTDAGTRLAHRLAEYVGRPDVVVLGLPRGGVPVAFKIAEALGAPLDVFTVRKLGVPGQPELAMGAVASGGIRVLNEQVLDLLSIEDETIDLVADRERRELHRREIAYRGHRPFPNLKGKIVIVVDDGAATGTTMSAALKALKRFEPARLVVALPTAPPETCQRFSREADECLCLMMPEWFQSVGEWYDDFRQTTDEEVKACLRSEW